MPYLPHYLPFYLPAAPRHAAFGDASMAVLGSQSAVGANLVESAVEANMAAERVVAANINEGAVSAERP